MTDSIAYVYGWIPWKQAYGGWARAICYTDGTVARLGNRNTLYPVSDHLAKRFKTEVPPHPAKALIGGL